MTIEEIKNLKDKIYEIEGLLELAQLREDKLSELEPLIKGRIRSLLEDAPADDIAEESFIIAEEEILASEEPELESVPEFEPEQESELEPEPEPEPLNTITELFEETDTVSVTQNPGTDATSLQKQAPVRKERTDKPAFCLNDRFRFRRELFANSDAEFSSAMNMIAAMESYEEAEEYFIDQLGWDMENQEVVDFMEIIRGYFES